MKEIKTVNLKVNELNIESTLELMKQGNSVFNEYAKWAYENGTYSKNKAHKALFFDLQPKYPLIKTGLQQAIRDNALECCKRNKLKGKIPEKKSNSVRLNTLCYTLRGQQLTLITANKRHKEILHIPNYYKKIYENWKPKRATLSYNKKKKQFWIHISFENLKPKEEQKQNRILGIDRGVYNIATTSEGKLFGGKDVIKKKNDYSYLRRKLQKKGTKSAKKLLKKISGKEKRFVLNANHVISKQIINSEYDTFVLEKLKSMHDKKRHKNWNRKVHGWSYFQLEQFLTYKANALGKHIKHVHPAYTSQTCSNCGRVDKTQRNKNTYKCVCGHKQHADINAAINIKNKFLRQSSKSDGVATDQPHKPTS